MNWWVIVALVVIVAVIVARLGQRDDPTVAQIRSGAPPTDAAVDALIAGGRKIDAIKVYRQIHHTGLKDAKDAVEARARQLPGR